MSCSIVNNDIRAVAKELGRNPEEVNAVFDIVNDIIGEGKDIVSLQRDNLSDIFSLVDGLFKDRSLEESRNLKSYLKEQVEKQNNVNPITVITSFAKSVANDTIRQEEAKERLFDSYDEMPNNKPKVKYYGPTMGKTTATKTNNKLVDFDDIARQPILDLAKRLGKTKKQVKMESGSEYKQLLINLINKWKENPENNGKTLVISNAVLSSEKFYDNIPSIPSKKEFVKRQVQRSEEKDKTTEELEKEASEYYDDLMKLNPNLALEDRFVSELEGNNDVFFNEAVSSVSSSESVDDFINVYGEVITEDKSLEVLEEISQLNERLSKNGVLKSVLMNIKRINGKGPRIRFEDRKTNRMFRVNANRNAYYDKANNEIVINSSYGFKKGVDENGYRYSELTETIFHEVMHSLTSNLLSKGNNRDRGNGLVSYIKKMAEEAGFDSSDYGFTNIDELLSELFDGDFYNKLQSIRRKNEVNEEIENLSVDKLSLIDRIIDAIRNFFKHLFSEEKNSLSKSEEISAFKLVKDFFDSIVDTEENFAKKAENGTNVYYNEANEVDEAMKMLDKIRNSEGVNKTISIGTIYSTIAKSGALSQESEEFKTELKDYIDSFLTTTMEGLTEDDFKKGSEKQVSLKGNIIRRFINIMSNQNLAKSFVSTIKTNKHFFDIGVTKYDYLAKCVLVFIDKDSEGAIRDEIESFYKEKASLSQERQNPSNEPKKGELHQDLMGVLEKPEGTTIERLNNKKLNPRDKIGYVTVGNYYVHIKNGVVNNEADMFRKDGDKLFRLKKPTQSEQYKDIIHDAQIEAENILKNTNRTNPSISEDKKTNAQKTIGIANGLEEKMAKVVFIDSNNSKTMYANTDVLRNGELNKALEKIDSDIKAGGDNNVHIPLPLNVFKSLREGDNIRLEYNGKMFIVDVRATYDREDGMIGVFGTVNISNTTNYNIQSAQMFDEFVGDLTSSERNNPTEDSFNKLNNAKQKIGIKYYEDRRNMIANDFVSALNKGGIMYNAAYEELRKQRDEMVGDSDSFKLNAYQRGNLTIKMNNLDPITILNTIGMPNAVKLLRKFYQDEMLNPTNPFFIAKSANPSKAMQDRISKYKKKLSTLTEDGVWDNIMWDTINLIADKLEAKIDYNDDNTSKNDGEEKHDFEDDNGILAFEETYIENWSLSPARQAKHESLTVELKKLLSNIEVYENGKKVIDDMGRSKYMDEEVAFRYLQSKLYDCQTMSELEERLGDIIRNRPQYQSLYDMCNPESEKYRPSVRAALFRAMYAQMKNLYATKYGTKKSGDDAIQNLISFQFNRNNATNTLVNNAFSNILEGNKMGDFSIYSTDGQIVVNNIRSLYDELAEFRKKLKGQDGRERAIGSAIKSKNKDLVKWAIEGIDKLNEAISKTASSDKRKKLEDYAKEISKEGTSLSLLHEYSQLLNKTLMALGFEYSNDDLNDLFLVEPKRLNSGNGKSSILDKIEKVLNINNGLLFTKAEGKGGLLGEFNSDKQETRDAFIDIAKSVNAISKDSIDSDMFENGKIVPAHTNPSYESKLYQKFKKNKEFFDKFIQDEYNQYEFFRAIGNANQIESAASEMFNWIRENLSSNDIQSDDELMKNYEILASENSDYNSVIEAYNYFYKTFSPKLDSPMPSVYVMNNRMNALLRDMEQDEKIRDGFQLMTLNHSRGKEYDDWSKADYASELMVQYFKELYDGRGNRLGNNNYIMIANSVLSDSPTAEFWRIKRRGTRNNGNELDLNYMDYNLSKEELDMYCGYLFGEKFDDIKEVKDNPSNELKLNRLTVYVEMTNIIQQEMNRIANVYARKIKNDECKAIFERDKDKMGYKTIKDVKSPDGSQMYIEPIAFYDIVTGTDKSGKTFIKNIGGAEFKFFPDMNGTDFMNKAMEILQTGSTYDMSNSSVRFEAFKNIVDIQKRSFENAYNNWKKIGLFDTETDRETGVEKYKYFTDTIPIYSKTRDIEDAFWEEEKTARDKFDNGEITEEVLDATLKNINERKKEALSEYSNDVSDESMDILQEYFDQTCLGTALIEQLTITDLAYYKNPNDFQKRYKQVYAPSQKLCTDIMIGGRKVPEFETTIYLKDIKMSSGKEMVEAIGNILRKSGMDERKVNEIMDAFDDNNISDAQAYRSLSSYRDVKAMAGELTTEDKIIMSRMIGDIDEVVKNMSPSELEEVKALGLSTKSYDKMSESEMLKQISEDAKCIFQTIKPFVYTQVGVDSGINNTKLKVGVQHKNSEFPLIWATELGKRYRKLLGGRGDVFRDIVELSEFMEENGIHVVQFDSAVKVGCQGAIDVSKKPTDMSLKDFLESQVYNGERNEDGSKVERKDIIHRIPYADYGIQASTPEHLIDVDQLVGSQIRRLIFADNNANTIFSVNGKRYTKEQLFSHYNALITENILENFRELDKIFENPEEVEKLIMREMQGNEQYTQEMMRACRLTIDPNTGKKVFNLLADPVVSTKIESLLNSIIRSRITKQKIRGGACIQVSCAFVDGLQVKWSKKDSEGNRHPVEMECYLGAYMEDMIKCAMDKKTGIISLDALKKRVDKETFKAITSAIGYRVPTEDKYSMCRLKIKGFLPANNGSSIMLPKEITTLSGSDFDVDKMYLMLHEFKNIVRFDDSPQNQQVILNNIYYVLSNVDMLRTIGNNVLVGGKRDKFKDKVEGTRNLFKNYVSMKIEYNKYLEKHKDDENKDDLMSLEEFSNNVDPELDIEEAIDFVNDFVKWAYQNKEDNVVARGFIDNLEKNGVSVYESIRVVKYNHSDKKNESNLDFGDEASNNTRAARNNEMIDIMMAIMSHKDTASKFLNPGSFDDQKKTARIIEVITNSSIDEINENLPEGKYISIGENGHGVYDVLNSLNLKQLEAMASSLRGRVNPLSPWTQVYFHDQNAVGGKLIGVYANHNSAHAAAQYIDLKLTNSSKFSFLGKTVTSLNSKNPSISKNNAGFLAASVDNVKDPVLYWLNQNGYTADASMLLSRLGYSSNDIGLFMNQKIIKDVAELSAKGEIGKKETLFAKAIKNNALFPKNIREKSVSEIVAFFKESYNSDGKGSKIPDRLNDRYSPDSNWFANEIMTPTQEGQIKVAKMFFHILSVAQELSEFTQLTKSDTQNGAAKASVSANIVKNRKISKMLKKTSKDNSMLSFDRSLFGRDGFGHIYNNGKIDNYSYNSIRERIYNSPYPMLTAFDNMGVFSTRRYLKDYFPWYSEKFTKMLDAFETIKGNDLTEDEIDSILNDFMIYWMTGINEFGGAYSSEYNTVYQQRKMYVNTFIDKFVELKGINPNIAKNEFIKSLKIKYVDAETNKVLQAGEIAKKANKNKTIVRILCLPDVGKLSKEKKQKLTSEWEKLYYSDNPQETQLAVNLIKYSFFRNGLGFGPDSFGHLAPLFRTEIDGYKERFMKMGEVSEFEINRFMEQYYRNHPNNNLIEKIDDDIAANYIKFTLNELRSVAGKDANVSLVRSVGDKKFKVTDSPDVILLKSNFLTGDTKVDAGRRIDDLAFTAKVYANINDQKDDVPIWDDLLLFKPFININNDVYKLSTVNGIRFYEKLTTLGMASDTDGAQFLEYNIQGDSEQSIFDFNVKMGKRGRTEDGKPSNKVNYNMVKAFGKYINRMVESNIYGESPRDILIDDMDNKVLYPYINRDSIIKGFLVSNSDAINSKDNNLVKTDAMTIFSGSRSNAESVKLFKELIGKANDEIPNICK